MFQTQKAYLRITVINVIKHRNSSSLSLISSLLCLGHRNKFLAVSLPRKDVCNIAMQRFWSQTHTKHTHKRYAFDWTKLTDVTIDFFRRRRRAGKAHAFDRALRYESANNLWSFYANSSISERHTNRRRTFKLCGLLFENILFHLD